LALEEAFELHRAPEAGREPVAVRRAPELRVSGFARRAGRLLMGFAAANAGLRSRECVVRRGGLKWGRAAAGFPLETGLRAAGVLGVWISADAPGLIKVGEAGEAGFRASNSNASFSWSRERRKFVEAVIDELE